MENLVRECVSRKALRLSNPTPKVAPKPTKRSVVYKLGKRVEIQGLSTKFYSTTDISKFWVEITYSHVKAWYRVGILPEPYMIRERYNGTPSPLWITEQAVRIHEVINHHWLRGFTKLTWRYRRTVRQLQELVDDARDRFDRKLERASESHAVTGVRWIDSREFGVNPGYEDSNLFFDYDDGS